MIYTTQGLMTPADIAEVQRDYDTAADAHCPGHYQDPLGTAYCSIADDCPGDYADQVKVPDAPMETYARMSLYRAGNGHHQLTPAQRRRTVKKAAREGWHVARDERGVKQLAF